jgi:NifU-like protein involved in Fe-S cluster formation
MNRVLNHQIPKKDNSYLTFYKLLKRKFKCVMIVEKNVNQKIAACESEA